MRPTECKWCGEDLPRTKPKHQVGRPRSFCHEYCSNAFFALQKRRDAAADKGKKLEIFTPAEWKKRQPRQVELEEMIAERTR